MNVIGVSRDVNVWNVLALFATTLVLVDHATGLVQMLVLLASCICTADAGIYACVLDQNVDPEKLDT